MWQWKLWGSHNWYEGNRNRFDYHEEWQACCQEITIEFLINLKDSQIAFLMLSTNDLKQVLNDFVHSKYEDGAYTEDFCIDRYCDVTYVRKDYWL